MKLADWQACISVNGSIHSRIIQCQLLLQAPGFLLYRRASDRRAQPGSAGVNMMWTDGYLWKQAH